MKGQGTFLNIIEDTYYTKFYVQYIDFTTGSVRMRRKGDIRLFIKDIFMKQIASSFFNIIINQSISMMTIKMQYCQDKEVQPYFYWWEGRGGGRKRHRICTFGFLWLLSFQTNILKIRNMTKQAHFFWILKSNESQDQDPQMHTYTNNGKSQMPCTVSICLLQLITFHQQLLHRVIPLTHFSLIILILHL